MINYIYVLYSLLKKLSMPCTLCLIFGIERVIINIINEKTF